MPQLALDNSMLGCFNQCQLKYQIRYRRHRATNQGERISTTIGVMLHEDANNMFLLNGKLMYCYTQHILALNEIPDPKDRESALNRYNIAFNQLIQAYPVSSTANKTVIINDSPTRPGGSRLSNRWTVRYSEIAFAIPLSPDNPNYIYTGKIDLIVEDNNGNLYIPDLKSSAHASNSTWQRQWRLDSQLKGYQWAVGQHIGKPIAGCIIIPIAMNPKNPELLPEIEIMHSPKTIMNWHSATFMQFSMIEKLIYQEQYSKAASFTAPSFLPTGQWNKSCSSQMLGVCDYYDYCRGDFNEEILNQITVVKEWNPLAKEILSNGK